MPDTDNPKLDNDAPRVYVGAYALCFDDDRRLLLCRIAPGYPDEGRWTLPGGGLEWDEAPELGVLRELGEETGLSARVDRIAGVYSHVYRKTTERPAPSVHHLGLVYHVEDLRGELMAEIHGSTDHCKWYTREELKTLSLVPLAEFVLPLAFP